MSFFKLEVLLATLRHVTSIPKILAGLVSFANKGFCYFITLFNRKEKNNIDSVSSSKMTPSCKLFIEFILSNSLWTVMITFIYWGSLFA